LGFWILDFSFVWVGVFAFPSFPCVWADWGFGFLLSAFGFGLRLVLGFG
jgi:hypothetical protein